MSVDKKCKHCNREVSEDSLFFCFTIPVVDEEANSMTFEYHEVCYRCICDLSDATRDWRRASGWD